MRRWRRCAWAGLRARDKINASYARTSSGVCYGRDSVVPLAVKIIAGEVDRSHLCVADGDAFWVEIIIDPAGHVQSGLGGGGADQLHDHLMADQRLTTPVLGDEGKQPVLDAVPLAGAGSLLSGSLSRDFADITVT